MLYQVSIIIIIIIIIIFIIIIIIIIIIHWHLSVLKDHRFAPILQRLLWLWKQIRERQSLSHLEHVKAVVGLLAKHAVFMKPFLFRF